MGDRIATIDPLTDKRWDTYVQNDPKGTIYHHSSWINLITQSFPYRSYCYALIEERTEFLKGLVPLMSSQVILRGGDLVSLPYSAYCDPLVCPQKLSEILQRAVQDHPKHPRVELKLSRDFAEIPKSLERESSFVNHTVDLSSGIEAAYEKFHRSCVRRKIKKAQANDLKWRFSDCEKDIKRIYNLLLTLRKNKGLPPHPYKFFLNMWKLLAPLNMMFAPYVTHQDKIVAAAIVLKFKDTIYYEYGASDPSYQKLGANQFLLWEIMKFGYATGAKVFNFGRSHLDNRSLIKFKDRWGGDCSALTYCYSSKNAEGKTTFNGIESFGKNLNRRLPNSILRLEGEFIYRFLR